VGGGRGPTALHSPHTPLPTRINRGDPPGRPLGKSPSFLSSSLGTEKDGHPVKMDRLDHLVLTVKNIDATCRFYARVLGMDIVTSGDHRQALSCGSQRINLHQAGRELEPKAHLPTPGSADLCFLTAASLEEVMAHLHDCKVEIILGPLRRTGATGEIMSVYFRDPDLNLIEVGVKR
jgi:catechol 2,3-dioxygenase-like lactoylglutathione lyase family enzyme